ncbi:TonB-dependent copper receptor [Stutzerimonas zhaodongensis]|uniref:TonB-dependent copper receptor n=1 Tax=Stutzerimonas zhaodongensis TaxID=1176257 RepID=A0A3M2HYL9_9GAMM|nr:TonB-dependent copper receptor [Stutzerimonas zhaodongensis]MCQ4316762.1 TonB-dependent copper receptor [Stutzerimonas zhaodongensis]RMH92509.1 TonB-dependent copper receptor [Stutzerimonas zhaodongensis]
MSRNSHDGLARERLSKTFSILPSRRRWQLAHAALLVMITSGALAAEGHAHHSDNAGAIELAPLVITGVAQQSPLTVVTDPKIPRQPVPASDAGDYLQTIPGFSAVRGGGSNSDPVFRGMFGSRLKLLSNGGEMLGACPSRMDSPSSYITPENYDNLTVIKGPQTVLWGPGNSAATILFERDPEDFTGLGGRVDASFLVGSDGRFDRNVDAAAGSDKGYLRLLANRSDSDDYQDGNGDRVHSRWDKWSTDMVLGWVPDDDTLLELTFGQGDGEARYAGRGMDGSQFDRESLALRFERDNLAEVLRKIDARIYYNYADHVMDNYSLRAPSGMGMMGRPMASNVDRRTLGGRFAATWQWDTYELVAGVDAQRNEHRKRSSQFNMMTGTLTEHDRFAWTKDADFHSYGLFGELTHDLNGDSRLIGGARLDHVQARDSRGANSSALDSRSDTLPSGFIRYEHDLQALSATVYAGLGHTQRFPDYWELFSGGADAFDKLRPEKTTQLDVGLQYSRGPLDAWASAYIGQIRDYVLFSYQTNMMGISTSTADNIDARIMGGEVGGSYRLSPNWKSDASLAYAWGKNSSDGEALPQMPPLEGRLGLTYEQGDWSAATLWRVVAAQSRIAAGKGNVTSKDFDDSSGFGVLSLNGAYRLNQHFKLSSGIDNLLDKAYSEHLNQAGNAGIGLPADARINEPGRTYWARVDMSF